MIDAFVFDFDGLIVDTEWCEYISISEQFERYGQRFRLQDLEGLRPLPSGILSVPRIVAER